MSLKRTRIKRESTD